jgi:hypothetical protein
MIGIADTLLLGAAIGALSGTHASIWGMYKDAIHEGFGRRRFARSIAIGLVAGALLQWWLALDLARASSWVLLFGLAYAIERGIVETWKTFIRSEDQGKYFIPMQFSIRGQPVTNPWVRLGAGCVYVAGVGGCLAAIAALSARIGPVTVTRAAMVGLLVGAIIAVGGAWKDAPKEGFDPLKFFRSPLMTVAYAMLLSRTSTDYLLIAAAAIGFERATAETYKTFFFPSRPRGKFAGKPVLFPDMLTRRRHFVPVYVTICAVMTALLVSAVLP